MLLSATTLSTQRSAPVLGDEPLDIRFLDSQLTGLRTTELLQFPPSAISQITAKSLSQKFAFGPPFPPGETLRLA